MVQKVKQKDNGGTEWMLLDGYGRSSRGRGKLWLSLVQTVTHPGGPFGFLSFTQLQFNHEGGPPGIKTDVHGLVLACHPAQQQPLPKQEEAQGAVRRRDHQTKAWRVS